MIEYVMLFFAIPLGIILAKLTKDEKEIYSKAPYFPVFLWIIAITASIFFTIDKMIALVLTFIFIMIFFWNQF